MLMLQNATTILDYLFWFNKQVFLFDVFVFHYFTIIYICVVGLCSGGFFHRRPRAVPVRGPK